jgi:hypothetical protein
LGLWTLEFSDIKFGKVGKLVGFSMVFYGEHGTVALPPKPIEHEPVPSPTHSASTYVKQPDLIFVEDGNFYSSLGVVLVVIMILVGVYFIIRKGFAGAAFREKQPAKGKANAVATEEIETDDDELDALVMDGQFLFDSMQDE